MRILWIDVDSLRPDHLGCYGYLRNTSPTVDAIAKDAVRFTGCYTSDGPCLPSRTALSTGRFGIHTGVVSHAGTAGDPFPLGRRRSFSGSRAYDTFFQALVRAGYHTASVSPFPQRHAAWWFLAGLNEWMNTGRNGLESAEEINAAALPWLQRHGDEDNWFLHVNYWDPHGPYTAPESHGHPFADEPPPAWYTEEIREAHWKSYGPHSAQEPGDWTARRRGHREPEAIASMDDWKRWIDGYDTGIHYMDSRLSQLLDVLDSKGVLDETAIVISADHGENLGELNVYGDHHTADDITPKVPFILRWPGVTQESVNDGLYYQFDLAATLLTLAGASVPEGWDALAFPAAIAGPDEKGREFLALSHCVWTCQRAIRWGDEIMIRTYHDGCHPFPAAMLFNVRDDPHEQRDLAEQMPDRVNDALARLEAWHAEMMASTTAPLPVDPMQTVLREGGPCYMPDAFPAYLQRLRATGRAHHAAELETRYGR